MSSVAGGLPFRFLDTEDSAEQSSMMPLRLQNKIVSNEVFIEDAELFPKFPLGNPLEEYRQSASFDWRKMRVFLKGKEGVQLQHDIWKFMKNNPVFGHSQTTLSLDETRHLAVLRHNEFHDATFFDLSRYLTCPEYERAMTEAMFSYDPSFFMRCLVSRGLFPFVLNALGTERLSKYLQQVEEGSIVGAYALTEVGHGSNVHGIQTTATYCPATDDFELHSDSFMAAKCWAGNLGKTCTHAIVFAQLVTQDGKNHGLNSFLVPVRDRQSHMPFSGVIVGDLGEKIALNGMDNGFLMFNKYRIPKVNLLSRHGDFTANGEFNGHLKHKTEKMGNTFGALSGARVGICGLATTYLTKAITIAIRFSVSRKQFGPDEGPELSVLEYQSQQFRLIPHLVNDYALLTFHRWLSEEYIKAWTKTITGENMSRYDPELHALSAVAKPICSWMARDAIQECREACGGHGYLKSAQLGELRNGNDANCTYEGENMVLAQQTSNWLLNVRKLGVQAFKEHSPLLTASFLVDTERILQGKFRWSTIEEILKPDNLLKALNWLVAYQLEKSFAKVERLRAEGKSAFEVKNNSQTFFAVSLSTIYAERTVFNAFYNLIMEGLADQPEERQVLLMLLSFFGINTLNKHMGTLYEGGFAAGERPAKLCREAILHLLPLIKREAIALVDAIAPPDFILNSPLGMSDGEMYKHLETSIMSSPEALTRPEWWPEIVHWKKNKL